MLQRIGRLGLVVLFVSVLFAAGIGSTPAHASPSDDAYIRSLVHATDIGHVTSLVHSALNYYGGGSSRIHHDTVYNALGRTTAALDELYTSGVTGDVFNTAEHLLLTQQNLLHELERFTLSGDLTDLSTVTPLLVDVAQARVAFERQSGFGHSGHLPSHSLGLSRGLLHNRSLSRSLLHDRGLSRGLLHDRGLSRGLLHNRSLSRGLLHNRSLSRSLLHDRGLSSSLLHDRSLLSRRFPSRSLSTLRHSFPSRSFSYGLSRFYR